MKPPKVRIGTLLLLVVIVALAVTLLAERRRTAALLAEVQVELARARLLAEWAANHAQLASSTRLLLRKGVEAKQARPDGLEPAAYSELASRIAADDLGAVPLDQVEVDLAGIAEGMPQTVDISDASSPYVVPRREKTQTRAATVRSARLDLLLKSAVKTIAKTSAQ